MELKSEHAKRVQNKLEGFRRLEKKLKRFEVDYNKLVELSGDNKEMFGAILEEKKEAIEATRAQVLKEFNSANELIDQIKEPTTQLVLSYKFIKNMTAQEIANELLYSPRSIFRILNAAYEELWPIIEKEEGAGPKA